MRKHYTIEDLEVLYNARTLFYELDLNDEPIKHPDTVGDNHGDLLHVGIRNGEYTICYYILIDEHQYEECVAGQKVLLNALNNGNIQPIESGINTEDVFNQLGESIKRIIKEEINEFEWAEESIKNYVDGYYTPEGIRPYVGQKIRVTSQDTSWMGDDDGYRECFDNPKDIVVEVYSVGIDWIEVSFLCKKDNYENGFYVPFSNINKRNVGFNTMGYYGIKITPYID